MRAIVYKSKFNWGKTNTTMPPKISSIPGELLPMSMATRGPLLLETFTSYFTQARLENLYFPNGRSWIDYGSNRFLHGKHVPFFIHLLDLYRHMLGWNMYGTVVPLEEVIAVIAFGSAVRVPGYTESVRTVKKYFFWGSERTVIDRTPIQPRDADFLVITQKSFIHETALYPLTMETYDAGTFITRGGIHIINRSVSQVIKGMKEGDTISISALEYGVPLFIDPLPFEVLSTLPEAKFSSLFVNWTETDERKLVGRIQ